MHIKKSNGSFRVFQIAFIKIHIIYYPTHPKPAIWEKFLNNNASTLPDYYNIIILKK